MAKTKYTIEDMKSFAALKGGECLSEKYQNYNSYLIWKCNKGHLWKSNWDNILHGKWCPNCAGNIKSTLKEIQELAKIKNGKCLSIKYINDRSKLIWQCEEHHIWKASANSVKAGHWCPYCVKKAKLTINEMRKIAEARGGKCLSNKYINAKTKLKWQCANGHIWKAEPTKIKTAKRWCPECDVPLSELICRTYFEQLFNKSFIKCRPDWLKNPITNYNLELDGFCEELNIAFEHNGKQHYKFNKTIHKNKEQFQDQIYRDKLKQELCIKNNIKLIVIPILFYKTKLENLKQFIINECEKQKIIVNLNKEINIDVDKIIYDFYG